MAIKIYLEPKKETKIEKDVYIRLVADPISKYPSLVVCDENGDCLDHGFIADITPDGLRLRGGFNDKDDLGIAAQGLRSTVKLS